MAELTFSAGPIYVYSFPDNHIYVGLTRNFEVRKKGHLEKGSVYKHSQKTQMIPTSEQLTDYIDVSEAIVQEGKILDHYKSLGYIPLNRIKTGGLGGNVKIWDYNAVKEEALKYKFLKNFRRNSPGAFQAAYKNKWIKKFNHFSMLEKPKRHWDNKNNVISEALKYSSKSEFAINSPSAYKGACRNAWIEEFTHFARPMPHNHFWTIDKILKVASDFKTVSEFKKLKSGAYDAARRSNILQRLKFKGN